MPYAPQRRRDEGDRCWCPHCEWESSVEEGEVCNLSECPICGRRLTNVPYQTITDKFFREVRLN